MQKKKRQRLLKEKSIEEIKKSMRNMKMSATSKNPQRRNKWRKRMKNVFAPRRIRSLRLLAINRSES